MAFLLPVIGAAAGLSSIGTALLSGAVAFGLSTLARQLAPEPTDLARGSRGMRLSLRLESNAEREAIFGTAATAGSLVYHNSYGPNGTDNVQLVYALADHPCEALIYVEVDGAALPLDAAGNVSGYNGKIVVKFYSGAWTQTADPDLVAHAKDGGWTADDRGRGVCYVVVTLFFDAGLFKSGLPHILFVVRGLRLYDPRFDTTVGGSGSQRYADPETWVWTDNAAVCLYNFRRGIVVNGSRLVGLSTPAENLPIDTWIAAANACDEMVARKNTSPERRYAVNGVVSTSTDNRSVVREMLSAMAASEVDSGGVIRLLPGVARTAVVNVTDADLMSDGDVEITPKLSRNELTNALFGSFHDPAQHYESVALSPRVSSADVASDGVELQKHFSLDFVTSGTQGQRVLEIFRRRERYQRRVSAKFRARCAVLEAGDWISWTSERYGFVAQSFEVMTAQLQPDLTVQLTMRDVDATVYAWTAATDEIDASAPRDISAGSATFQQVTGLDVATVSITAAGVQTRPGLQATWTPITDASVTSLVLEYRIAGDTTALSVTVQVPISGSYTWVTGVQGGVNYEVRALPVVTPARPVVWTGWMSTQTITPPVVVTASATPPVIPDDSIEPAKLSEEARRQLELTLTISAVLDDLNRQRVINERHDIAAVRNVLVSHRNRADVFHETIIQDQANRSFAQQLEVLSASIGTAEASISTLSQATATTDSALASRIDTVETTVGGNTSSIQQITESIDGIGSRWTLQITDGDTVAGLVQLDGTDPLSVFRVDAGKFEVRLPGVAGGGSVPVFAIANVGGSPKIAFRGDMLADGTITAAKIAAGTITADKIQTDTLTVRRVADVDNTSFVDFTPGNKRIRLVS